MIIKQIIAILAIIFTFLYCGVNTDKLNTINSGSAGNTGNTGTTDTIIPPTGGTTITPKGTVSVTVTGLTLGTLDTLILQNNGSDNLNITSDGTYTFSIPLNYGDAYNITILPPLPTGHTCNLSGIISGFIASPNISLNLACGTMAFTLGGTLSGLDFGKSVTIQNQFEVFTLTVNGNYTFPNSLIFNSNYLVTIADDPAGQKCTITPGTESGTILNNVSNVDITCAESIPPITAINIDGYVGNLAQNVTLTCTDSVSGCKRIVYTTNGTIPAIASTGLVTNGTEVSGNSVANIPILSDTKLRYFSEDNVENKEPYRERDFHVSTTGGILYVATTNGLSIGSGSIPASYKDHSVNLLASQIHPLFFDPVTNITYLCTDSSLNISNDGGASWTRRTNLNGLPQYGCNGVFAYGKNVYVATYAGLAISTDNGNTFTVKTSLNGLGSNFVLGVFVKGNTIYAATRTYNSGTTATINTGGGLSISTDGGANFINKTTAQGLGSNNVYSVYVSGSTIFAATSPDFFHNTPGGVSISTDGGANFINRTTSNGLRDNWVFDIKVVGSTVYAGTQYGLSISSDNGQNFIYKNIDSGSGPMQVNNIFVNGNNILLATTGINSSGDCPFSISTNGGINFIPKTTGDGLGSGIGYGVYASGNNIYVSTSGGYSTSTDNGATFTNKTSSNGLGFINVNNVYADGTTIYAATGCTFAGGGYFGNGEDCGGLSISNDRGNTFIIKNMTNGLPANSALDVISAGGKIFVSTGFMINGVLTGGIAVSTDATGTSFQLSDTFVASRFFNDLGTIYASSGVNFNGFARTSDLGLNYSYTTQFGSGIDNGLGSDNVYQIFASGLNIYAATDGGLSISNDGGVTFVTRNDHCGIPTSYNTVYISGSSIYVGAGDLGLCISNDGGVTWSLKSTPEGLGSPVINHIYLAGGVLYIATQNFLNFSGGLSISTDGGSSFTNYTTADGLASNNINGVAYVP